MGSRWAPACANINFMGCLLHERGVLLRMFHLRNNLICIFQLNLVCEFLDAKPRLDIYFWNNDIKSKFDVFIVLKTDTHTQHVGKINDYIFYLKHLFNSRNMIYNAHSPTVWYV
jgi:hypothetical protein